MTKSSIAATDRHSYITVRSQPSVYCRIANALITTQRALLLLQWSAGVLQPIADCCTHLPTFWQLGFGYCWSSTIESWRCLCRCWRRLRRGFKLGCFLAHRAVSLYGVLLLCWLLSVVVAGCVAVIRSASWRAISIIVVPPPVCITAVGQYVDRMTRSYYASISCRNKLAGPMTTSTS